MRQALTGPYDRGVPDTLDRIDDELFATDYRVTLLRHLTVLPEPPTIRLRLVADSPRVRLRLQPPGPDETTVRLPARPVVGTVVGRYHRVRGALWSAGRATGGWPAVLPRTRRAQGQARRRAPQRGAPYRARVHPAGVYRASVHRRAEDGTEAVVFVGLVVLVVVGVAATGVIVWWWA